MARGSCDDRDHIGRMSLFNYLAFTLKCSFISFKVAFVCLVCRKVVQSKYSCFPDHESFFFFNDCEFIHYFSKLQNGYK